jgi:hypothetical protein
MPSLKRLRAPSPATAIALVALFVALGGAAYAIGTNDVKSRHIARGAVKGTDIAKNAVKTAKIRNDAVTAGKIADGAVGQSELAEDSVSRQKIKAQAVTTPKIADTAVTTEKLADGAVTAAKLGANSVTSGAVKAALTVTVDPPAASPDEDCVRASQSVAGVAPGDHVIVTIPSISPGLVAAGDANVDEVGVRVCNIDEPANLDPMQFPVLVID